MASAGIDGGRERVRCKTRLEDTGSNLPMHLWSVLKIELFTPKTSGKPLRSFPLIEQVTH